MLSLILAFLFAAAACTLVAGALTSSAQSTTNFKPDPFVTQVTSSTRNSFAGDMSANGRFVVIDSTGDIATLKPGQTAATKSPNNTAGNLELCFHDYEQRRIFH